MPAAIPIAALAITAVGTGMQIYGANKAADAQKQEIEAQRQIEEQRKRQMELEARRKQLEIVRQQQRARSAALTTTTAQGASFGSGLGGSYGQISGVSNFNAMGVQQNLEIGRNIFGLNSNISDARMAYADAQSLQATGQGISSLGNALFKNIGPISSMTTPGSSQGTSVGYPTYGGFIKSVGSNGIY